MLHVSIIIRSKLWSSVLKIVWDLSSADEETTPLYVADLLNGKRQKLVIVHVLTLGGLRRDRAIQESTFAEFRDSLGELVNQWIESGKLNRDARGEEPLNRNVTWHSPQYPTPLRDILRRFWERNSLIVMQDAEDGRPTARLDLRHGPKKLAASAFIAREFGIAWFQRLLDSVSPQRLSLCDYCRDYFVRTRTPKKDTPIKRGIYCANCKNMGGAKRRGDGRKALKSDMLEAAAKVWSEWKPSHENPDQRTWLAAQLSRQFKRRLKAPLTRRWVSRNLDAIQTEVKRRKDA
jgi:hypothetical protein